MIVISIRCFTKIIEVLPLTAYESLNGPKKVPKYQNKLLMRNIIFLMVISFFINTNIYILATY